jgi:hypothetical protein
MKTFLSYFFIGIFIFVFAGQTIVFAAEPLRLDDKQVVYPLPYPGILSDHPLYGLKSMRDQIIIFTTRDNLKKAQLYLHMSDKRIAISLELARKGKETLAKEELLKAEELFLNIPPLLRQATEQGTAPSNDFLSELSQSNAKHKEVITEVMKQINQAEIATFNTIIQKNEEASREIGKI